MKVTPQITADLEEYPELRKLVPTVIRPVVDLMSAHAIAALRRMHKVGVFDHPYAKDVVTPMDIPSVPQSIRATQYTVSKALLDYLEAVGISGVTLELSQDEALTIAELWTGPRKKPEVPPAGEDKLNPIPADKPAEPENPEGRQAPEEVPGQEDNNNKEEQENGEHA